MALSDKPWGNIGMMDYADAQDFCDASLLDQNQPGQPKIKTNCKLQVREPKAMGGMVNRNGMAACAAALAGARTPLQASPAEKRSAARKLIQLYRENNMTPPASTTRLAQG